MAKELITFTPMQMDKAQQLENVAARYAQLRELWQSVPGEGPLHRMYKTAEGKLDYYPVDEHTIFGFFLVRRALMQDLHDPQTAWELVEKYLSPGESL